MLGGHYQGKLAVRLCCKKIRLLSLKLLALAALSLLVTSCSTNSTITYSYVDPLLRKLDLQGVLVVGVAQNRENRIIFENMLVKALKGHDVHAVAAHSILPQKDTMPTSDAKSKNADKNDQKLSAEDVVLAAAANDLDTVLVTRYVGAVSQEIYHPGTIYYGVTPMYGAAYYGGFPGYYGHAYEVAYQQPVWTTNTTHEVTADLYVAATHDHIWTALTYTLTAAPTHKRRHDVIPSLTRVLTPPQILP